MFNFVSCLSCERYVSVCLPLFVLFGVSWEQYCLLFYFIYFFFFFIFSLGRFVHRSSVSIVLILPGPECSCASRNRSRSVCLIYDFLTSQVSIEKLRSSVVYGARICEVFLLPFVPLFFLMIFVYILFNHSRICLWIFILFRRIVHTWIICIVRHTSSHTVVFNVFDNFCLVVPLKNYFRPFVTHLKFYLFYQLNTHNICWFGHRLQRIYDLNNVYFDSANILTDWDVILMFGVISFVSSSSDKKALTFFEWQFENS